MNVNNILLEKSLMNCHCEGMDSLVLKDAPNMVRMFVARNNHELWRNSVDDKYRFSVALHRHHCDVTLHPVFGNIYNVSVSDNVDDGEILWLKSWKYRSPILLGDTGGFEPVDPMVMPINLLSRKIEAPLYLRANELHTIYVPSGQPAAWYVWEGDENPDHSSIVYSNDNDLGKFNFSKLDQPMTEARLKEDLAMLRVYV